MIVNKKTDRAKKVTKTQKSTRAKKGKGNWPFISKLKSIVLGDDYLDDDFDDPGYVYVDIDGNVKKPSDYVYIDNDGNVKKPSRAEKAAVTKKINALKKDSETLVLKPRSFDDLPQVMSSLRDRKTIILNLILLNDVEAQRAIDFVAGGSYLIDSDQEKIHKYIYRFTPGNMNVISFRKSSSSINKIKREEAKKAKEAIDKLGKDFEILKEEYIQNACDFDNFRKRTSRDQDDFKFQTTCKVVTLLLPLLDNFERAREQFKPESKEAQTLHKSYQGLYKQLVEVLKKLEVSPMLVVGQEFDPNFHEAVLREPSEEFKEDFIIEELKRGYYLKGKVLRHALVKVSMGPLKAKATVSTDKDLEEKKNKSQVKRRGRNKK